MPAGSAFMLALLSISLLVIGEITALQTLALLSSVPLIALLFYLCYAGIRLVKKWGARDLILNRGNLISLLQNPQN